MRMVLLTNDAEKVISMLENNLRVSNIDRRSWGAEQLLFIDRKILKLQKNLWKKHCVENPVLDYLADR
jgi:hypothetical protein